MGICSVFGCGNSHRKNCKLPPNEKVSFYSFPSKEPYQSQWVHFCGRKNSINVKHARICSVHFTPEDRVDYLKNRLLGLSPKHERQVKSDAVPSLHGPRVPKLTENQIKSKRERSKRLERRARRQIVNTLLSESTGTVIEKPNEVPEELEAVISVKTLTIENDENLEVGPSDTISETELPDGTVCQFYSSYLAEESTSNDPGGEIETFGPKIEAVFPVKAADESQENDVIIEYIKGEMDQQSTYIRKRKASEDPLAQLDGIRPTKMRTGITSRVLQDDASSKNTSMDFEKILSALEQDQITMPSLWWSHTRLGQTILIFLCWSEELKLTKKAIFRKGSQMSLYIGDQLLADGSTQDVMFDLEECLRLLDMFEQCKGLFNNNSTWSESCTKYILLADGNESCTACRAAADAVRRSCQRSGAPVVAGAAPLLVGLQQTVPNHEPQGLDALLNCNFLTSMSKNVVACPPQTASKQNVKVEARNMGTNSEYVVVDFVVSGDRIAPNIRPHPVPSGDLQSQNRMLKENAVSKAPRGKKPKAKKIVVDDQSVALPSESLQSQKMKIASGKSCFPRKKPTARKSTGGPFKFPQSIAIAESSEETRTDVIEPDDHSSVAIVDESVRTPNDVPCHIEFPQTNDEDDLPGCSKEQAEDTGTLEAKSHSPRTSDEDDLLENSKESTEYIMSEAKSHSLQTRNEDDLPESSRQRTDDTRTLEANPHSPRTSDEDDLLENSQEPTEYTIMSETKSHSPQTRNEDDDLLESSNEPTEEARLSEVKSLSPRTNIPEVEYDAQRLTEVSRSPARSTTAISSVQPSPATSPDGSKKGDPS